MSGVVCKQCGASPGSKNWPDWDRRFVLRQEVTLNLGDHGEVVTEDAGLFCSKTCAGSYLLNGEHAAVPQTAEEGRE